MDEIIEENRYHFFALINKDIFLNSKYFTTLNEEDFQAFIIQSLKNILLINPDRQGLLSLIVKTVEYKPELLINYNITTRLTINRDDLVFHIVDTYKLLTFINEDIIELLMI